MSVAPWAAVPRCSRSQSTGAQLSPCYSHIRGIHNPETGFVGTAAASSWSTGMPLSLQENAQTPLATSSRVYLASGPLAVGCSLRFSLWGPVLLPPKLFSPLFSPHTSKTMAAPGSR